MSRLFVVNVLLGIPGIFYFWILATYISAGVGASGSSVGFMEHLQGYFSSNLVLGPPLAIGAIVWVFVNASLAKRRMSAGACLNASGKTAHWITAAASTLVVPLAVVGVSTLI